MNFQYLGCTEEERVSGEFNKSRSARDSFLGVCTRVMHVKIIWLKNKIKLILQNFVITRGDQTKNSTPADFYFMKWEAKWNEKNI